MRKGILEYCILLILNQRRSYSADILEVLKDHNLIVVEGTLYPLLTRLRKDGFLDYTWEESPQGPPRKYYVLTKEGHEWLQQLASAWSEMRQSITALEKGTNNYPEISPFENRDCDQLFVEKDN